MSIILALLISFATPDASAKRKPAKTAKAPSEVTLNDAWYVMQAGSSPWGYFHEVIAKKDGKYFYRYDMTKKENGRLFQENLGAIARLDLTPVAFNLNKQSAEDSVQSFSGTYQDNGDVGVFTVKVKGSVEKSFKRHVSRATILEVFFPVWLHQRWKDIEKGFRGTLPIFTEDVETSEYKVRTAAFEYVGEKQVGKTQCKELKVVFDGRKSSWCLNENGGLEIMTLGENEITVRKVANEAQAKSAL